MLWRVCTQHRSPGSAARWKADALTRITKMMAGSPGAAYAAVAAAAALAAVATYALTARRLACLQRRRASITLKYFDIPGLGEPIRMALSYAGVRFTDQRLSREQFGAIKPELKFGQVPCLIVDGQEIFQSAAILRYIGRALDPSGTRAAASSTDAGVRWPSAARREPAGQQRGRDARALRQHRSRAAGPPAARSHTSAPPSLPRAAGTLYPAADLALAAAVDGIMDQCADMMIGRKVYKYKQRFGFPDSVFTPAVTQTVEDTWRDETLPRHLGFFARCLAASPSGWLAGTPGPSCADFLLAAILKTDVSKVAPLPNVLADWVERVYALPAVKAWKEKEAAARTAT